MIGHYQIQNKQNNETLLVSLEQEARQFSYAIINTGIETDPVIFSNLISRFLHIVGKLRRLRVKLEIRKS